MKTIVNYGMTYYEDGTKKDRLFFSKMSLIRAYLNILDSRRNVSFLQCYQWEGKRNPKLVYITDSINRFLYR